MTDEIIRYPETEEPDSPPSAIQFFSPAESEFTNRFHLAPNHLLATAGSDVGARLPLRSLRP
ncbi:hypothetical protein [Sphingobium sp. CCH11-B1]|uniref:hypothetical protein n=1 Tax=Sphingobium sp. CCH11-B1 TaxID=1768781 RepID=UPI000A4C57BE|nr:hypothetical protein [Sphingobium sp. CCH11-B1]